MSDNEFKDEFFNKSKYIYGKAATEKLLAELESLDPRESNLIYRVFRYDPSSVEYAHTKTRLSALVSAGVISDDMYNAATTGNEENFKNVAMDAYNKSRLDLLSKLDLFSLNSGESNLLDPSGELEYRINQGYTKDSIMEYLNSLSAYNGLSEASRGLSDDSDMEDRLSAFKLNEFIDSLNKLEDPEVAVDFKEIAKEKLAKYDVSGQLSRMIDGGASANEVLQELNDHPDWVEDSNDFLTRDFVDSPRYAQIANWNTFLSTLNSIKDLDNL